MIGNVCLLYRRYELMRAAFLDWDSVNANDLDARCLAELPLDWTYYPKVSAAELDQLLTDTAVLVSNKVVLDAASIARAKALRLICVAATGTNNIDLTAAAKRDIPVCNVTAYATDSVVQHVFMLLLNLVRQQPAYQEALVRGRWQQSQHFCFLDFSIESLAGKTLGIVGYGELGRAVANMAKHFGMHVLIAQSMQGEPSKDRLPLDELLGQVDVLSLHCPLTTQTRHLISERELGLMKPSAILLNTARGGLVDEAALLQALDNRQIAAAGLDVLELEPPGQDHPLLRIQRPNLVITPHIAWASRQARQKLVNGVAANIDNWLKGKVTNRVN
jgi:glycerate dehydrogenase